MAKQPSPINVIADAVKQNVPAMPNVHVTTEPSQDEPASPAEPKTVERINGVTIETY